MSIPLHVTVYFSLKDKITAQKECHLEKDQLVVCGVGGKAELIHLEIMANANVLESRKSWHSPQATLSNRISCSLWLPSCLIWQFLIFFTSPIHHEKNGSPTKYPLMYNSTLSAIPSLFPSPALSFQTHILLPLMMCCSALWTYKFKRRILHLDKDSVPQATGGHITQGIVWC